MFARFAVVVLVLALPLCAGAAEETIQQRIVGLSDPSRQDDLREIVKSLPDVQLVSLDFETAAATFKYDPAKLFTNYNPKQPQKAEAAVKRLEELLNSASRGTFGLKPLGTLAKDKLKVEEIGVGVLDCKGCRYGVYLAVSKVEGVERATVSSEKSSVTVWIDPAKTNRAALEAALKKANVELPGH